MSKTESISAVLSNITEPERRGLQQLINYTQIQSLPEIWPLAAEKFGDLIALHDPHAKPEVKITYTQLAQQIQQFASGLQALGIQVGDRISLIADNSPWWFIADQGVMTVGAVDAVRSSQAEREELLFIITNSGSTVLVLEDLKTLKKLRGGLDELPIELVILLTNETPPTAETIKVVNFSQLMEIGVKHNFEPVTYNIDSLATLIYTSGTTGKPKGVMLSYRNFMHQVLTMGVVVQPQPGDVVLSILPSWHSYERTVEYFLLSQGCQQIYTNLRSVKRDLREFKPHYMVGVPRLWESIYEGVQKQFREQPAQKQQLINFFLGISNKYIRARRIAQNLSLDHLHASMIERWQARIIASSLFPLQALAEKLVYHQIRDSYRRKGEADD